MLRIRFSRTGKAGQPSYRIVVAQRTAAVKGKYIELLGNYMPARKPKTISLNKERVAYWISKGAVPTDTAASLFKKEGMAGMEKYLEPRTKKRTAKSQQAEAKPAAPAQPAKLTTPEAPAKKAEAPAPAAK